MNWKNKALLVFEYTLTVVFGIFALIMYSGFFFVEGHLLFLVGGLAGTGCAGVGIVSIELMKLKHKLRLR